MASKLLNDYQIKLVKDKMREKGLSVNRLALLAKITPTDLYSVCKGEKPLFPRWKSAISDELNITEDEWEGRR